MSDMTLFNLLYAALAGVWLVMTIAAYLDYRRRKRKDHPSIDKRFMKYEFIITDWNRITAMKNKLIICSANGPDLWLELTPEQTEIVLNWMEKQ